MTPAQEKPPGGDPTVPDQVVTTTTTQDFNRGRRVWQYRLGYESWDDRNRGGCR